MRYSFGLLKPDCLERNLVGKAFELIQSRGLRIVYLKQTKLNRKDVEFLYSRCLKSTFFENLVNFMTSGDVIIYLVKSDTKNDAISILNSVTGFTDPSGAKPNTLRGLGESVCRNIAHSTADRESFWSEVIYFINNQHVA